MVYVWFASFDTLLLILDFDFEMMMVWVLLFVFRWLIWYSCLFLCVWYVIYHFNVDMWCLFYKFGVVVSCCWCRLCWCVSCIVWLLNYEFDLRVVISVFVLILYATCLCFLRHDIMVWLLTCDCWFVSFDMVIDVRFMMMFFCLRYICYVLMYDFWFAGFVVSLLIVYFCCWFVSCVVYRVVSDVWLMICVLCCLFWFVILYVLFWFCWGILVSVWFMIIYV